MGESEVNFDCGTRTTLSYDTFKKISDHLKGNNKNPTTQWRISKETKTNPHSVGVALNLLFGKGLISIKDNKISWNNNGV